MQENSDKAELGLIFLQGEAVRDVGKVVLVVEVDTPTCAAWVSYKMDDSPNPPTDLNFDPPTSPGSHEARKPQCLQGLGQKHDKSTVQEAEMKPQEARTKVGSRDSLGLCKDSHPGVNETP